MRNRSRYLVPLLCALAAAACSEAAITPSAPLPTPAFSANPASQGAIIDRYESGYIITAWDEQQQLLVGHHYIDRFTFCGQGSPTIRRATLKEVITSPDPQDAELVRLLLKGSDSYITVHHSADGIVNRALICSPPIAAGFGRIIETDNDTDAWDADRRRVDAFGWMAQAILHDADGGAYHYNGVFRAKWQPNSGDPDYRYSEVFFLNFLKQGK